jgi:hypothetical protein
MEVTIMSEDASFDSLGESNASLSRIQQWRDQFDADMDAIRNALQRLRAPCLKERMSAEDCAWLWSIGIKCEDDTIRESWTI